VVYWVAQLGGFFDVPRLGSLGFCVSCAVLVGALSTQSAAQTRLSHRYIAHINAHTHPYTRTLTKTIAQQFCAFWRKFAEIGDMAYTKCELAKGNEGKQWCYMDVTG